MIIKWPLVFWEHASFHKKLFHDSLNDDVLTLPQKPQIFDEFHIRNFYGVVWLKCLWYHIWQLYRYILFIQIELWSIETNETSILFYLYKFICIIDMSQWFIFDFIYYMHPWMMCFNKNGIPKFSILKVCTHLDNNCGNNNNDRYISQWLNTKRWCTVLLNRIRYQTKFSIHWWFPEAW